MLKESMGRGKARQKHCIPLRKSMAAALASNSSLRVPCLGSQLLGLHLRQMHLLSASMCAASTAACILFYFEMCSQLMGSPARARS